MKSKFPTVLVFVFIIIFGLGGFIYYLSTKAPDNPYVGMTNRDVLNTCTTEMATKYHIHVSLKMMADKQGLTVPAGVGIDEKNNCMRAIHIHDDNHIIHVESPVQKDFTLGDFFYVWGKTFTKDRVLDYKVDAEHGLKMYVDGKEVQDFDNLPLSDTQDIFIDYYNLKDGPDPVPPFDVWPGGKRNTQDKPLA